MGKTNKLQMAVNHAVNDMRLARARMGLINQGMGLDYKRSAAWCEYGWPDRIEFDDLYKLYARSGTAHGAVSKIIGACWKTNPWVIEGDDQDESRAETTWEKSLTPLASVAFWRGIMEADRRRLVGRYSGLVLRIRDNGKWHEEVKAKGKELVEVIPVWANCLEVSEWDTDINSASYGKPKMWRYVEAGFNGGVGNRIRIHPDRVFIFGDYSADAIGFLDPAYNAFVSLEKVEGGSGESFLKNAARQLNINFDKEIDFANLASMYGVSPNELQEKFNEVAVELNRANDTVLPTQGATVTPLVTTVADPRPTYEINLQTAAAALDIPTRILTGNQTGERASSEDREYFNARCQARRIGELSYELHSLFAHLMRIHVVGSMSEYTVMWDDLSDTKLADKLANAKTLSDINAMSLASGEEAFGIDEIRIVAGFDPRGDSEPLPDDVDDDQDTTADTAEE